MTALTQAGLCEGYGGLTLAVRAVLGARLAWYSEIDPAACRLLAHHHPDLPNLGDLTTADWEAAPRVDILTGGWPCQPWSLAGRRKGAEDERAIWPSVARAVRALRPRLVVLENVASIAPAGELARAAGDLAALGYVGSWRSVRASDIGAPHRRERLFIVAEDADSAARGERRLTAPGQAEGRRPRADAGRRGGAPAAHTGEPGREGRLGQVAVPLGQRSAPDGTGAAAPEHRGLVADTERLDGREQDGYAAQWGRQEHAEQARVGGRERDWAGYATAIHRWERALGRPAPAPTVLSRRSGQQLSPLFVEWMMGLPEGHVTGVPGLTRNEQLKLLGNGVVPQQAEAALRHLLAAGQAGVAA